MPVELGGLGLSPDVAGRLSPRRAMMLLQTRDAAIDSAKSFNAADFVADKKANWNPRHGKAS